MKKLCKRMAVSIAMLLCFIVNGEAQSIMGLVVAAGIEGKEEPVAGASALWLGTTQGTTTRDNGVFMIDRNAETDQLVISFVGMRPDTIRVNDRTQLKVILIPDAELQEVVVEGRLPSTTFDHSRAINTQLMSEKELFKAACCNLSESFETNPSVDVAFTDAITGTKQIQMLGLSGPNTLITIENMPGMRGLASSQGIQFIPGSWISSIEVTKGVGSVLNGYESIAGQINVSMKKPEDSEKLFVNAYINQSGRSEVNANATMMAGKKWATTFLLHGSARPFAMDQNGDEFLDFPTGHQLNFVNRWVYHSGSGWLAQIGLHMLRDNKLGGEKDFSEEDKFTTDRYGFEINTDRTVLWGKLGYQFPGKPYKSLGLQLSGSRHDHGSYFGFTSHDAIENTFYSNLIYQSIIGSTNHAFKVGLSFLHNDVDEILSNANGAIFLPEDGPPGINSLGFDRTEVVPGAFVEYTYNYLDKVTIVAGIRADRHNLFGTFFTPRLHTRFGISPLSTLRLSAGKGIRSAYVIAENISVLASSRNIIFSGRQSPYAYGYKPDEAWNFGTNFTQDFTLNYRPGTIGLDYYYTDFVSQVVTDLDKSTREVNFSSLDGKSFSHSLQAQVDYEVIRRLDLRLSYRFLDVKTTYSAGLLERPLIARHRAFANMAYETKNKWKFDLTVQWIGQQRIPYTGENPATYQLPSRSPDYILVNSQVTKDFNTRFSLYVGVENLANYSLEDPIVAADVPFGPYFDSSLVWGPVFGRMLYAGVRWNIR